MISLWGITIKVGRIWAYLRIFGGLLCIGVLMIYSVPTHSMDSNPTESPPVDSDVLVILSLYTQLMDLTPHIIFSVCRLN